LTLSATATQTTVMSSPPVSKGFASSAPTRASRGRAAVGTTVHAASAPQRVPLPSSELTGCPCCARRWGRICRSRRPPTPPLETAHQRRAGITIVSAGRQSDEHLRAKHSAFERRPPLVLPSQCRAQGTTCRIDRSRCRTLPPTQRRMTRIRCYNAGPGTIRSCRACICTSSGSLALPRPV